ncbi:tubulin epsilon and delta complex protein 2 isoform X2 [Scyliorhinus canicula]|uniref:tubulin epsilon and delta complex protein 2 isoform X2 n=1 Tax=Scyliorhinus canicula TaxID=7830 RepID=UPI0018F3F335|nr:tubulin epsilon and delta complex protein 2 isoform X2 [Scyliorhinus canicula]XP_038675933.1 tubulin epsilon and delta complex protein 2 isoform X2 [Scyliorhinus canicula]
MLYRLSSLLDEAIKECTEEERKLEAELKSYRMLLKPWNPCAGESPVKDGATAIKTELHRKRSRLFHSSTVFLYNSETESLAQPAYIDHDCSSEELQELEVLNRALAKALRIRQTHHNVLETELIQPHTSEGSTVPTDKGYGAAKQQTASSCGDKPSADVLFRTLRSNAKNKVASASMNNVGGKVTAPECRESVTEPSNLTDRLTGRMVTAQTVSSRKPVCYTLKVPYKTKPEVRKFVPSAGGQLARGSLQTQASLVQTAAKRHTKQPVSVDGAGSRSRQNRLRCIKSAPRTVIPHSVQTPTCTDALPRTVTSHSVLNPARSDTAPTLAFAVISQQRANCIKESVQLSASGRNMPLAESSSMEKPKLFTLQESGSVLKLPLEWRKQRSRNARLRERVSTGDTEQIQETASFMQRLQSAFHSQLPTINYAQIEKQLDNIREFYKCIDQYVHTDPMLNSSGPLSWQHEYESLQILERCQDTVSSLVHQIQQLMDAEAFWVKFGSCRRLSFKMCNDFGSECAPLLFYSSLQDLKEIEDLRFQVQTLQRQIQIQKAMAEELLPILLSSGPPEQSPYHRYRAVYSLLCEGGEQFPTLVLDNIPE